MIKILHSGDWHLDAPLQGRPQADFLRHELEKIPGKIARLCKDEACDLMLLSGDLFDGAYSRSSYRAVYEALESVKIPVFITPGNHDYISPDSPYEKEVWPENVFIFTKQQIRRVDVPELGCCVYGAGFQSMDCPALLEGFRAEGLSVGVFHGDPAQVNSSYNPVTRQQVVDSGLSYLALGHVHKGGAFRAGETLCAWPGCPMGKGWDETGEKGVLIVTLDETAQAKFIPLDVPEFHDLTVDIQQGLGSVMPGSGNEDFYRVTLVGEAETVDLEVIKAEFSAFPNLELRNHTVKPVDLWQSLGQDSFEGVYFGLLKEALSQADGEEAEQILLAARISRQLLDGQEVALP